MRGTGVENLKKEKQKYKKTVEKSDFVRDMGVSYKGVKKNMKIKCQHCEKNAELNIQKVWIKWKYDYKTETYSDNYEVLLDVEEPVNEDNIHLCRRCFCRWKKGEI